MPDVERHIRSIMVPLDGSGLAEQALPMACAIADWTRARLHLVLVHQPLSIPPDPASATLYSSTELTVRTAERSYLEKARERLQESGRTVSIATVSGPVTPALSKHGHEVAADLIVMATHGRGPVQRMWLGSVADGLVRGSEIPVLLVRPAAGEAGPVWTIPRIMVPLDGSALSEEALEIAAALAGACDAELDLVEVVRPVLLAIDPALPFPSAYDQELSTLARARAQNYLHDIAERYRARGLRVSAAACIGWDPVQTLLELARPARYGLLVLASHGLGGVRRLAAGSVADKLVRAADVPVLVCSHPRRTSRSTGSIKRRSRKEAFVPPS
jgi:nucleotide-binding universal stress UspA family protein